MKKLACFSTALLASLVLTACGSGGSGNNSAQPTANSQQPTANSQQPTANSQQPIQNFLP